MFAFRADALRWISIGLITLSCSDTVSVTPTRTLRGASDVAVLCAAREGGNLLGRPIESCPDLNRQDGEERRTYALLTQKETGEVAVVDMGGCGNAASCAGSVIDLEITQPGTNFLPIGGEPVSIVATDDGVASFVAVAEPGREGIFGLPTSCIGTRPPDALFRDIRTFPACRLPVAPSVMALVKDEQRETLCDGTLPERNSNAECPAELDADGQSRTKLLVALPSLGQVAVIDAQALLDAPGGSFEACPVERLLSLSVELPEAPIRSALPPDLAAAPAECLPEGFRHKRPESFSARPSDFALQGQTLYVSDYDAPVVHVLDVTDPCSVEERPPLLPQSVVDPSRVVTTRRVAASPLTPGGKEFVYAVDDSPEGAGSIMIFDVSRESGRRTPLVRPRSHIITQEPPDRIQFDQEVSDVVFAVHDVPAVDPRTGVAVENVACEPLPDRSRSVGALYRPDPEEGEGAGPRTLRGAFAFAVLHSGFVVAVDIEDLDAPCRRPKTVNPLSTPDLYGCADDPYPGLLEDDGSPTVSDEFSCHITEPHRPRAGTYFFSGVGGSAPALRAFPQLRDRTGASLTTDQSASGRGHPRLLAVNPSTPSGEVGHAQVTVGTTLYDSREGSADRLVIDPAESERNSVVLPLAEPRAYTNDMLVTVTYEGFVRPRSDGLIDVVDVAELELPPAEAERLSRQRYGVVSRGPNATFCDSGIEDDLLIRDRLSRLDQGASESELREFAAQYGDYVDITGELLEEDEPYWNTRVGRSCGEGIVEREDAARGHFLCELVFGRADLPNTTREFRIQRAFNDKLIVEPRRFRNETERENILDLVECCFPQNVDFSVRASQHWVVRTNGRFPSDVGTDPQTLACTRDCNPLVAGRNSRAFEISCEGEDDCRVDEETTRVIGPPQFREDDRSLGASKVCILGAHPVSGIQPGGEGAECIFESHTARFAIYRGLLPSERDMQFSFRTLGGFSPLALDLLDINDGRTTTSPQRLLYVPSANHLWIADGGSTGLVTIGLRREDGGPGFSGAVAF